MTALARTSRLLSVSLAIVWHLAAVSVASAQPVGVFRWQLEPHCNVVTLSIVREESSFLLTGLDDMCGGTAAPTTGTAVQNPDGTIALGFVVVTPSGSPAHVSATVDLTTVSGTWRDADGNGGPFRFNPQTHDGSPRPAPRSPSVITSAQLAASIFAGSGAATTVARSDHTHDDRYYTKAETDVVVAAAGAAVVVGAGFNIPTTLTPLSINTFIDEIVVTPKAGRLLITKMSDVSLRCSAPGGVLFYLLLDGVPIRSSVVRSDEGFLGQMSGVTTESVTAGRHVVSIAGQCRNGNPTGGTTGLATLSSVIVLP